MHVSPNYGPYSMGAYPYTMTMRPSFFGYQIPESVMDTVIKGNVQGRRTPENLNDSEGFAEIDLNDGQVRYEIVYTQVQRDVRTLRTLGNIFDYIRGLNKTTSLQSEVWGYFIEIAHEMRISLKGDFERFLNAEYPQFKADYIEVLNRYPIQTEENKNCIVM